MSDSGSSLGGWLFAGALAFAAYSCSSSEKAERVASETGLSQEAAASYVSAADGDVDAAVEDFREDRRDDFDEDAARRKAEDDLASESYDGSYGCTIDCSGHDAGWRWRAENGYSTSGNSQSFEEGAQAFDDAVEDRVEEARQAYENGEDPE